MPDAIDIFPEARAMQDAIAAIHREDIPTAVKLLRDVMEKGGPVPEPDNRPDALIWLRAHIEKALIELTHERGGVEYALHTLRYGLTGDPTADRPSPV